MPVPVPHKSETPTLWISIEMEFLSIMEPKFCPLWELIPVSDIKLLHGLETL